MLGGGGSLSIVTTLCLRTSLQYCRSIFHNFILYSMRSCFHYTGSQIPNCITSLLTIILCSGGSQFSFPLITPDSARWNIFSLHSLKVFFPFFILTLLFCDDLHYIVTDHKFAFIQPESVWLIYGWFNSKVSFFSPITLNSFTLTFYLCLWFINEQMNLKTTELEMNQLYHVGEIIPSEGKKNDPNRFWHKDFIPSN